MYVLFCKKNNISCNTNVCIHWKKIFYMYIVFWKVIYETDNQKWAILSVVECWWEYFADLEQCEYSVLRRAYWTAGYTSDTTSSRGLKCLLARSKILGDSAHICNTKSWHCISVGVSGRGCLQALLYTCLWSKFIMPYSLTNNFKCRWSLVSIYLRVFNNLYLSLTKQSNINTQ